MSLIVILSSNIMITLLAGHAYNLYKSAGWGGGGLKFLYAQGGMKIFCMSLTKFSWNPLGVLNDHSLYPPILLKWWFNFGGWGGGDVLITKLSFVIFKLSSIKVNCFVILSQLYQRYCVSNKGDKAYLCFCHTKFCHFVI